ncbi:MAG: hypothetical protein AB1815_03660 [Bacillota bacterium]
MTDNLHASGNFYACEAFAIECACPDFGYRVAIEGIRNRYIR